MIWEILDEQARNMVVASADACAHIKSDRISAKEIFDRVRKR